MIEEIGRDILDLSTENSVTFLLCLLCREGIPGQNISQWNLRWNKVYSQWFGGTIHALAFQIFICNNLSLEVLQTTMTAMLLKCVFFSDLLVSPASGSNSLHKHAAHPWVSEHFVLWVWQTQGKGLFINSVFKAKAFHITFMYQSKRDWCIFTKNPVILIFKLFVR